MAGMADLIWKEKTMQFVHDGIPFVRGFFLDIKVW